MAKSAREIVEILTAILLGLVSVATAFGAYQASVWAEESRDYRLISDQLRDRNLAQVITVELLYRDDAQRLLRAIAIETEQLIAPEDYYELELQKIATINSGSALLAEEWEAWYDSGRTAAFPMSSETYSVSLFAPAQSMNYASFVAEQHADAIEARATQVTVAAVVFAVALLLLGVANIFARWTVSLTVVGGATVAFAIGVVIVLLAVF